MTDEKRDEERVDLEVGEGGEVEQVDGSDVDPEKKKKDDKDESEGEGE
jgi:hypothetical protein